MQTAVNPTEKPFFVTSIAILVCIINTRRNIQGVSKKTLRKFNRLLCIINVAKQFDFYIGRKSCYLAFL